MSKRGTVYRCQNRSRKRGESFEKYSWKQCRGCDWLKAHLADHWLDDIVECTVPMDIGFRDKFRHEPERFVRVREYKRQRKESK